MRSWRSFPQRSVDDWVLAHAFVHTFIERIKQNAKERQGVALTAPSSSAVDGVGRGPPHTMYRHAAKVTGSRLSPVKWCP